MWCLCLQLKKKVEIVKLVIISWASQLIVIFWIWRKKPRDDNELGGLLLSSTLEEKTKRWRQQASQLVVVFYN
jgi:hypothetical protein